MNRIVLVGNGFDLAYGLKTRYDDFIRDYLIKALTQKSYEDKLIRFVNRGHTISEGNFKGFEITDLLNWPINEGRFVEFEFKNNFFERLTRGNNWVDLENYYFQEILKLLSMPSNHKNDSIKNLNEAFDEIRNHMINYIKKVDEDIVLDQKKLQPFFKRCGESLDHEDYYSFFDRDAIPEFDLVHPDIRYLNSVYFVNFNYTSLLERSLSLYNKHHIIFNIHGQISDPESVIFGYGDDTHKQYQELEDENNPDFLVNMKSFYYNFSADYINLMSSLEQDKYEVFVVGHSLGLSDRVLLKSIFEHKNCKAIRLFHKDSKESYFQKCIALSRHCSDKASMRSKIEQYSSQDLIYPTEVLASHN